MANDGKSLEALVAQVEELLQPQGMVVKRGEKHFFEDGKQEVEFDVTVRGKVGSASMSWLIECRDRPSVGAAGADWIQQIAGRRAAYHFSKATAVSTTGFSKSAQKMADRLDVELRTVGEVSGTDITAWLKQVAFVFSERRMDIKSLNLSPFDEGTSDDHANWHKWAEGKSFLEPILRRNIDGEMVAPSGVLQHSAEEAGLWNSNIIHNGPEFVLNFDVQFRRSDDVYMIDLPSGPLAIKNIKARIGLRIIETMTKVQSLKDYKIEGVDEPVSRVADFVPVTTSDGAKFEMAFHQTGKGVHFLMKKTPQPLK